MDPTPTSYVSEEKSMMNDSTQPAEQATPNNTPQPESTDMQLSQSEEKIPDVPPRGCLTISTMPKCEMDAKPDFEFSTLPVYVAPVYVDPTSYKFIVS